MLKSKYFILLPIFIWTITLLLFRDYMEGILLTAIIGLPVVLMSAPSRIIFLHRRRYGYFHFYMALLSLFGFLLLVFRNERGWIPPEFKDLLIISFYVPTFVLVLSFFVAIPLIIIPHFRGKITVAAERKKEPFTVDFINKSFVNIKNGFSQIQATIGREAAGIDNAVRQFEKELRLQEKILQRTQEELNNAKEEAERYQAIADLTKEQRDAFLKLLGRQKYVDYVAGFILGIIGTLVVHWFPKLLTLFK